MNSTPSAFIKNLISLAAASYKPVGRYKWTAVLQKPGFTVEAKAMSQGTPFANVLLVARLPIAA